MLSLVRGHTAFNCQCQPFHFGLMECDPLRFGHWCHWCQRTPACGSHCWECKSKACLIEVMQVAPLGISCQFHLQVRWKVVQANGKLNVPVQVGSAPIPGLVKEALWMLQCPCLNWIHLFEGLTDGPHPIFNATFLSSVNFCHGRGLTKTNVHFQKNQSAVNWLTLNTALFCHAAFTLFCLL